MEGYFYDKVLSYYKNNNINIINIKSKLSHDGYDEDGPKSDIRSIIVYYKYPNSYNFGHDVWSRDWYCYDGPDNNSYKIYNHYDRELFIIDSETDYEKENRPIKIYKKSIGRL